MCTREVMYPASRTLVKRTSWEYSADRSHCVLVHLLHKLLDGTVPFPGLKL